MDKTKYLLVCSTKSAFIECSPHCLRMVCQSCWFLYFVANQNTLKTVSSYYLYYLSSEDFVKVCQTLHKLFKSHHVAGGVISTSISSDSSSHSSPLRNIRNTSTNSVMEDRSCLPVALFMLICSRQSTEWLKDVFSSLEKWLGPSSDHFRWPP